MENQMQTSYLLQMPPLVMDKIMSSVLNLMNVSCTCKRLYEIVCDMEKRRRTLSIRRDVDDSARLTIDDDAVFASIMNSSRSVSEIQLDVHSYRFPHLELNERQLERLSAILKRFGTNIISIMLSRILLSTDKIIELLNLAPKLESLKFCRVKACGNAATSLHLSSFKTLEISYCTGLLDIVNSIPAGSLAYFCSFETQKYHQPEILQNIIMRQHNIKSLKINDSSDPAALCVNHLKLDKLELGCRFTYDNDQLMEILKCHTNLKELRLSTYYDYLQSRSISANGVLKWICDNLTELEVLEMPINSMGENFMLGKKLRHFSTSPMHLPQDGFQFKNDLLDTLKIRYSTGGWYYEDFNTVVRSMVRTFTNLTVLEMPLADFFQLSIVLSQCTTLIMITTIIIKDPNPHQLAQQRFPNIRHLTIDTYSLSVSMSVITSIVRAMPNLKSLWMPCTTIIVNVNEVKEFINASKSLEDLHVFKFKLERDLSATGDFVETLRRLSDQLKAYRFTFCSNAHLYSNTIEDILSNEFNVRRTSGGYFDLRKGVLSKFSVQR